MTHPSLQKDAQMTHSLTPRPARRTSYAALALFAVAYLGVMVIVFAPKGSFSSRDSMVAATQTE